MLKIGIFDRYCAVVEHDTFNLKHHFPVFDTPCGSFWTLEHFFHEGPGPPNSKLISPDRGSSQGGESEATPQTRVTHPAGWPVPRDEDHRQSI